MRALLICVVAVSVAGCTFGAKTCSDTSECGADATCQQGFCVAIGGETGGGSGGGSGGGTATGGGTAQGGGTGMDGGMDAGPSACELLNCAEACLDVDGGASCVGYFSGIATRAPDAGSVLASGIATFDAELLLAGTVSGTPPYPASLLGIIDGVAATFATTATPGLYRISTPATCSNATRVVSWSVALEDGGFDAQSSYTCDGKAPALTWGGVANGNQFKRDDVLVAELNSDEPVSNTMVTLAGSTVEVSLLGVDGGACAALGGCWKLDFSKPALSAISQQWDLVAQAVDRVGNPGTTQLQVGVSRERWHVRLTTSALNAAPAVGTGGFIYTGSSNGSDTGTVYRVDPLTGQTDAGVSVGAVQGVALANSGNAEFLYVAANNGTNGQLFGRPTSDLSATGGFQAACGSNGNTFIRVAPALVFVPDGDGGGEVAAVVTSNNNGGTQGRFMRWTPQNACESLSVSNNLTAETLTPPLNVVVANAVTSPAARFVRNASGAWALREVTGITQGPVLSSSTIDLDGGGSQYQALVNGNSLISSVADDELNPSNGLEGRNTRSLVSTVPGAGGVSWTYHGQWALWATGLPAVPSLGAPSMLNSASAYVGFGTQVMRFSPAAPGLLADSEIVPGVTASTDIKTAPVLLAPIEGVSWGYVVDANGQIGAFTTQGSGAPWFSQEGTPHAVAAHPGFGCNTRPGAAQNTGVLYIASTNGYLRAIIVDGKKLSDATGAWPKYQRTIGNAGNDDTSTFLTNAGCP